MSLLRVTVGSDSYARTPCFTLLQTSNRRLGKNHACHDMIFMEISERKFPDVGVLIHVKIVRYVALHRFSRASRDASDLGGNASGHTTKRSFRRIINKRLAHVP